MFAHDQVAELSPPATPTPLIAPIAEIRGGNHERLLSLAHEIGYRMRIHHRTLSAAGEGLAHAGRGVSAAKVDRTSIKP